MVIYDRAIFVAVALGCYVKKVSCKTWTGILANNADSEQTQQKAACDQGLDCVLKLQS